MRKKYFQAYISTEKTTSYDLIDLFDNLKIVTFKI